MPAFTQDGKIDMTTADGTAEMEMRVECSLDGDIRNFQVVVEQKGLVLRGRALTYRAKQLAHDLVLEASDLPVLDEIEVW